MKPSKSKARFYTDINEQDYLGLTVWPGNQTRQGRLLPFFLDKGPEKTGRPLDA